VSNAYATKYLYLKANVRNEDVTLRRTSNRLKKKNRRDIYSTYMVAGRYGLLLVTNGRAGWRLIILC